MDQDDEIAKKLMKSLGIMKHNYDILRDRRGKYKKSLSTIKENIKELSNEYQILRAVYPLESEKIVRKNKILHYKLKKMQTLKQFDTNQLIELQALSDKSIAQLDSERRRFEKSNEKKNSALDDLQQISDIVQCLQSTPSKEEMGSKIEANIRTTTQRNETEKQQLIYTINALKDEYDRIDETGRGLQLKLTSKIREITDFEDRISYKDDVISDLRYNLSDLNEKIEYNDSQFDDLVIEIDELQNSTKKIGHDLQEINEERTKTGQLLLVKRKKCQNLRNELKKYYAYVETTINNETIKIEMDSKKKIQEVQHVIDEKDKEIETLEQKLNRTKQEIDEINLKQEIASQDIEEEKEKIEKIKKEYSEKLQSMQSIIVSLTSKILN